MKRLFIAALLAVFVAGPTLASRAADPSAEKAAEGEKGKKTVMRPFRGTIKSYDKTSQILTLDGEKAPSYRITSTTRIFKENKQATADVLTTGEMVMGSTREAADGKLDVWIIRVGKPAPRNVPPSEKAKGDEKK